MLILYEFPPLQGLNACLFGRQVYTVQSYRNPAKMLDMVVLFVIPFFILALNHSFIESFIMVFVL
ncbi:MAG: hypothetical protein DRJ05_08045 [Bacteroidetes bacterium]|nr:MAG: hypothetical protein DRJ05_08045 [Bacteroidota bacterium]